MVLVVKQIQKNKKNITTNLRIYFFKNIVALCNKMFYVFVIYLATNEANFIEDQKSLFKNNASLNRIYTNIPNNVKTLAQDFHSRIIDNLRSLPNPSSLTNSDISSLNNKDVLIFNNGSSPINYIINVSQLFSLFLQ